MVAVSTQVAIFLGIFATILLTTFAVAIYYYLTMKQMKLQAGTHESEIQLLKIKVEQTFQDVEIWQQKHRESEGELIAARTVAERASCLDNEVTELRQNLATSREEAAQMRKRAGRVSAIEKEIGDIRESLTTALHDKRALQEKIEADARTHREKTDALTAIRGEIEAKLKVIAQEALQANQALFLQSSNELFSRHQTAASTEMEIRKTAVEALVKPIQEMMKDYKENLSNMEKEHARSAGALIHELKTVAEVQQMARTETSKLVMALRASPKTRGRWGEVTLKNVLELSGLTEYCDFYVEKTINQDEIQLRPDVIIRLPGNRTLVVDAKTPLSGYLDAIEVVDEKERERHLDAHAAQLRQHVHKLSDKGYWERLSNTPDFVVMFVPGENFYGAAAERAQDLFEFAVTKRVIITTPATLIALAKAVAFGWRQEKVADNARRVHDLGRDLYKRMSTMGEHIEGVHKGLTSAVKKYNSFVGSLESSVMPQARRFQELEVEGTSQPLPPLEVIETEPRFLSGRDISPSSFESATP